MRVPAGGGAGGGAVALTSRQGYLHCTPSLGVLDPNWIAYTGTSFLTGLPRGDVC